MTLLKKFVKPMEVNGTSSPFTIFLGAFSVIVTTSAFVKKKSSKMRHLKKIVKPCAPYFDLHGFQKILIVTTSAFVKKERSKMRHLKKFVKPMEVKLRSKMSH